MRDSFKGPQVREVRLVAGDAVVLATDGLTRYLSEPREITAMIEGVPPREACGRLVAHALARGGEDNVTVVVVRLM